ncbi:MAG: TonB-dependent siderophore receptor [Caulobacterales bacterium]|nr:TonB-dependent siderophore receptor [Caulobacterales bacterium]
MSAPSQFRLALLTSAAVLIGAPVAHAADAAAADAAAGGGAAVGEVVVTGQKQQYRGDVPIKELPQNVQVVSAKVLDAVGVTRLDAALDLVSGVEHQNNFGGLWDAFSVRGFSGDPNVPSGYLVNGFNSGRGFGGPRDASNVESIEVLKGPGSALFGRGEPGGTVNIITKKPQFSQAGSVRVSAGSYSTYRAEGDYTNAITENVAARINGAYEDADSFRDYLHSKKFVVTPSVLAKLGDKDTASYEFEFVRQEVPFDRGLVALNGNVHTLPASRFLGEPGDGPNKDHVEGHQLQLQHDFNSVWTLLLGAGYRHTELKGYSTQAELATARQLLYVDGHTLSRQRRYIDYDADHTVLRGELDGRFDTGPFTHHVLFGADGEHFNLDSLQERVRPPAASTHPTLTAANAVDIFNPVYGNTPPLTIAQAFTNTLEKQKAWGAYGQDQIDITSTVKLRLGVRYDEFKQNITNRLNGVVSGQDIHHVSPQVGVVWEPTPIVSLYAAYAKGFRPNSGTDVRNTAFAPEKTKSREIGVKLQTPDHRITATIALYKMDKDNIITADPVNTGFSIAIGKAQSKGVEVDVDGKLPGDVYGKLSYAYTDAKTTTPILDADFGRPIPAGAKLLDVPKNSFNLLLSKDFEFNQDRVLTVGGDVHYVGKRLGETATTFMLPSYTLVELFASYTPVEHVKVSAEVHNLFDKFYIPASYSQLWMTPGSPRTFTVRVAYTF